MAKKQNEYRRLPGGYAFIVTTTQSKLYLGEDHLLRVSTSGWTERYRRFYFRDIQAIIVSLTKGRAVWTAVHLVFCALCLIWLLAAEEEGLRVVAGCFAVFFGAICLINVLRGPTCLARIQTRIGIEPLPSLRRLRNARKLLALLGPHIEAAQGESGPGMLAPGARPLETSWDV